MRFLCILFLFFLASMAYSQKGENTYEFLNLPSSAHVGSLGGKNVSHFSTDLGMAYNNPALLRDTMNLQLSINYINYLADLNFGYAAFAKDIGEFGTLAIGVQYIHYGDFDQTDDTGVELGTFTAQESALGIIWSYPITHKWNVGINLKQIFSSFEQYASYGLVFDAGLNYYDPQKLFSAGLVFKNFGTQITTYADNNFEKMPFEIMAGVTQKLAHAPFRFSLTATHLQTPDLSYTTGISSTSQFATDEDEISFGNNLLRHAVVGVEFVPFSNFYIAAGYNFQRRYELANENNQSTVGVSWGFGLKLKRFKISYGSARYHLAATSNHFSFTVDISSF